MAVVEEDEHEPVSSVFFQEAFKFLEDLGYMGERSTSCKKMERDRKGCLPLKKNSSCRDVVGLSKATAVLQCTQTLSFAVERRCR